eukprot:g25832.t1
MLGLCYLVSLWLEARVERALERTLYENLDPRRAPRPTLDSLQNIVASSSGLAKKFAVQMYRHFPALYVLSSSL